MIYPSGEGYLLPGWYGTEQHQHCVSGPRIRKKRWQQLMWPWPTVAQHTRCFKMKSTSISAPKSALTGHYTGSRNNLPRRCKTESIIWPGHCTAEREKSVMQAATVKAQPYLSVCWNNWRQRIGGPKQLRSLLIITSFTKAVKRCPGSRRIRSSG